MLGGSPPTTQPIDAATSDVRAGMRHDRSALLLLRHVKLARAREQYRRAYSALHDADTVLSANDVIIDLRTDIQRAEADNQHAERWWNTPQKARAFDLSALRLERNALTILSNLPTTPPGGTQLEACGSNGPSGVAVEVAERGQQGAHGFVALGSQTHTFVLGSTYHAAPLSYKTRSRHPNCTASQRGKVGGTSRSSRHASRSAFSAAASNREPRAAIAARSRSTS